MGPPAARSPPPQCQWGLWVGSRDRDHGTQAPEQGNQTGEPTWVLPTWCGVRMGLCVENHTMARDTGGRPRAVSREGRTRARLLQAQRRLPAHLRSIRTVQLRGGSGTLPMTVAGTEARAATTTKSSLRRRKPDVLSPITWACPKSQTPVTRRRRTMGTAEEHAVLAKGC